MATDKRFVVKNGLQTENINFVFNDAVLGSSNITATMLSSNTLAFSGTTGQLFSITDSMTGVIFAVNDISGVPSIEVYDDGRIVLAETFGNVTIGNSTISSSRTSTSTTTGILQVAGGAGITGNINVGGTRNLFTGSVGIGTSAVLGANANVLSVYGTAMVFGNIDLGNPTGGTSGIYFNDGSYQTTAFTGAATPSFGAAGTVQYAGAGNTFSGNSDSFFWDSANGRLGIGTNSPTNVLTVRSTATPAWFNTVNSAIGSNNFEIIVGNGTSTGTTVGYVNNTLVPYGYLSAGTATRNITIAANGRVGIGGVTAPQVLLDVGGGTVIGSSWAGNSNFINPPTNGLAVQGSVGIGTYSPLSTLDVRGGVGVTAASNFGGAVTVASLASNGAVSGTTGTFTGALYGASLNTAGTATVSALVSNGAISGTTITGTAGTFTSIQNSGIERAANIVSNTWIHATQNLTVASSNASTTSATGALVVTGGVGIGGRLNVAGNSYYTGILNTGSNLIAQSINSNTNVVGVNLQSTGQSSLASAVINTNITTTTLNSTGAAIVSSLNSNTNVVATNLQSTGQATVASLVSNGAVSGTTGTFTSALYGASFNTGGTATVNALVSNTDVKTATVNASSTIVGANIYSNGFVQAAGTVEGNAIDSNTTITAGTGITVTSGGINVTGASQFTGNVSISGNLNVVGTINTQNANVLIVNDPIIYLGEGNTGTNWDLGLIGNYNDGVYEHTGLVRNHVTGVWTLFDTLPTEPNVSTGNVDWSNSSLTYAAFLVGNVNVAGQTDSISTTTGAIRVLGQGGVGIGGRLNVGGASWFASTLNAGGAFIAQTINSNTNVVGVNLQSTGQATVSTLVSNGAVSGTTGTFTGALYGASFNTAGTATVNALVSNGAITGTTITGTAGTFTSIQNSGLTRSANIVSNTWIHATQNLTVASSNTSTSTTTGALVLSGGAGIAGAVHAGGLIYGASTLNIAGAAQVNSLISNSAISGTTITGTAGTFTSIQNSGLTRSANIVSNTWIHATQNLTVASSNTSTSTTTGAFVLSGGAGIAGAVHVGGLIYGASTLNIAGAAQVNSLISNGAVSGTTGTFSGDLTIADKIVHSGDTNTAIRFPANDTFTIETNGTERFRVDASGNVGIGTTTIQTGYMLQVEGGFAAINKSFVINHPTKSGYKLQYASLEGPENGVYVRGRLKGESRIELPDYWLGLVDQSTITVNLTPIGHTQNLYVSDIDQNSVWIGADSDADIHCFYTVYAERKDIEKLTVEYKER